MSKSSLDMMATRKGVASKGEASPATLESRKLESKKEISEDRNLENYLGNSLERKKPWDGHDEWVKVGYEVPKRVQMKLNHLKASGRFKNLREFVPGALEAAADAEIARAEEEGY